MIMDTVTGIRIVTHIAMMIRIIIVTLSITMITIYALRICTF